MAKRKKIINTRLEIIQVGTRLFLEEGYTTTTASRVCKEIGISLGNLTFHFPTKEHLLAELVEMLCEFQWKMMGNEESNHIRDYCLELAVMASICEENESAKNFYLSSYTHRLTLDIIRKSDKERSKLIYADYCRDWNDEKFAEAEDIVSGIEFATLATTDESRTIKERVRAAIDAIMSIYNVPVDLRRKCADEALTMDFRRIGRHLLADFGNYVNNTNEEALMAAKKKRTK